MIVTPAPLALDLPQRTKPADVSRSSLTVSLDMAMRARHKQAITQQKVDGNTTRGYIVACADRLPARKTDHIAVYTRYDDHSINKFGGGGRPMVLVTFCEENGDALLEGEFTSVPRVGETVVLHFTKKPTRSGSRSPIGIVSMVEWFFQADVEAATVWFYELKTAADRAEPIAAPDTAPP